MACMMGSSMMDGGLSALLFPGQCVSRWWVSVWREPAWTLKDRSGCQRTQKEARVTPSQDRTGQKTARQKGGGIKPSGQRQLLNVTYRIWIVLQLSSRPATPRVHKYLSIITKERRALPEMEDSFTFWESSKHRA
ncbi:hypothetical protein B0T16DRAFT_442226 [Cercophora newfieldiana]|uniref:Uncharacterized protein n=1 Tax=Cercophora newfieldiana TaxID=92897 RepID=A0AA39YS37_9PEZI|nr:hypothetical protein B0T16DRAFT_442226 [Cercophora newfieldiana]